MTLEQRFENFKKKLQERNTRGNIDLSEFVYQGSKIKSWAIDHDLRPDGTEYGRFEQTPSNLLKGEEHPDKRAARISKSKRFNWETIVAKCKAAHPGENLEYPYQEIKNYHDFITFIDHDLRPDGTEYGIYTQELNSHIRGSGHMDKARDRNAERQRYDNEKFITLAKQVHIDKSYDYSLCNYTGSRNEVQIICNKIGSDGKPHGMFSVVPDNFLQGKGCPKCGNHLSYGELEIKDHLESFGIVCEHNDHKVLDGLEVDIYCPEYKIGIEFNGLRWHSEKFKSNKNYHLNKMLKANDVGVKLYQVFEDEWLFHKTLVLKKLDHIFNINRPVNSVGARKCCVMEIGKHDACEFLDKWHIQGFASSTVYIGAFYSDILVGVMTFKKEKAGMWELNRFAVHGEYNIPGLGGKMFMWFVRNYTPIEVKSFADRRWTQDVDNNMYIKIGFELDSVSRPDYRYVVGNERKHKFQFRKNILARKYGVDPNLTEKQICKELGFERIWDCGLIKYVWRSQQTKSE